MNRRRIPAHADLHSQPTRGARVINAADWLVQLVTGVLIGLVLVAALVAARETGGTFERPTYQQEFGRTAVTPSPQPGTAPVVEAQP